MLSTLGSFAQEMVNFIHTTQDANKSNLKLLRFSDPIED